MARYCRRIPRLLLAIMVVAAPIGVLEPVARAQEGQPVEGWPRVYDHDGYKLVVYQPQIREWESYTHIRAMAAVQVTPPGSREGSYGAVTIEADTQTNFDTRMVAFNNMQITDISFPNVDEATSLTSADVVRKALTPKTPVPISLDRVVAALERSGYQTREVEVNLEPPPIFYSDKPAILVIFLGEPKFEPVAGGSLLFAVNTNWDIFLDTSAATYYLLDGESWLTAKDVLKGPWAPATALPTALSSLPDDDNWKEVTANVPGKPASVNVAEISSISPTNRHAFGVAIRMRCAVRECSPGFPWPNASGSSVQLTRSLETTCDHSYIAPERRKNTWYSPFQ